MATPLLACANVISTSGYVEDLNTLNLNTNDQSNAIEQINIEVEQELLEIEAQRKNAQIIRIKLIYENAFFVENGAHKSMYPPAKEFITRIESQVGVINFIKDLEISGPVVNTAFTIIKVAAYVYVFPHIKAKSVQLIKNYLRRVPLVGSLLSTSLNFGLNVINFPNDFATWTWDLEKYSAQNREMDCDDSLGEFIFTKDEIRELYETSNLGETKCMGIVIGLSLLLAPTAITAAMDKINKLRANHLLNQDWARTFFSSYFEWKVRKLKNIEAQYSIPDVFRSDPILNQSKYKCDQSGQFLIIPFNTPSNQVFQYSVIEDWLISHHTCPITSENLQASQLSFDATIYDEMRYRLQSITNRPILLDS